MLLQQYFFLITVILCKVNSSFNPDPTYKNVGIQNINGTTIQISDDQTMIATGFADGTFKIFDIQVNELCSNVSTANSSIKGSVWMPNFGPVTFDQSGKVIIWSTQCVITNQTSFTDPIISIGFFQSVDNTTGNATGLISLNFGSWIQQYDVTNFAQLTKYQADGSDSFVDFLYYNDGQNDMLIASTQGSKIRVMSMQDGSQSDSFDTASPIKIMTNIEATSGNQILGLGQDNKIYRFTSAGDPFQLGTFSSSNSIAFCPSTKQFALAWSQSQAIGVYLSSGNQQKSLVGLQGISQQIDCSNTYLVSIDDKGYINVYTYEQFKAWIIGVIVGIAGGLLLLLVGVIVFIRLRRKWARQAQQQKNYSNKPKKYPRNANKKIAKLDSMNMLQNMTLQTTIRQ